MFWRTGHDRSRSPEFKFESKRPKVFGSLVPFVSPKKSSQSLPAVWRIGAIAGIAVALILSLSAPKLRAQATVLGTLTGTITDPSGATVPGAKVTATNIATNESQSARTNSAGQYRISNLLPGQYTLTIEAEGFKTIVIAAFKLEVGQTLTQNRQLSVGSTSQRVQVLAQAPLLQTTSTGNSTTIGEEQINDLPLNGRNYMRLIDLTPGADGTRISGQWSDGNRFTLDGANNTTLIGATSAYVPNLDLIQEFSIDSNSSKAENGGFLGATVSVATKSGTNLLKGDAWWFGRSQQWEARNPITNPPGAPLPLYHFNQYGVTLGGPVYVPKVYNGRDKTFFFFGFQRTQTAQQSYDYNRVPTASELAGDFTNSLFFVGSPGIQHLYDPATTIIGPSGVPTRTPFLNDVIPPQRINPLVQKYLEYILPPPNFTPNANFPTDNRLDLFPIPAFTNDYSIRIDQKFGDRDSIFGRYSWVANASTSYLTAAPITQVESLNRNNLVIDWVHIFTPSLFLESNYAYQRFPLTINNGFPGDVTQQLESIGFSASHIATYGLPDFFGTGTEAPYIIGHYEQGQRSPYSFNEALNWSVGKHTMRLGINLARNDYQNIALGHHYTFSSVQTANPDLSAPNAADTGNGLASALLGLPSAVSLYQGNYTESFLNYAPYAEDEWKLRSNLTVSLGLRWDFFPTPHFTQGLINDWDFNNGIWYIGGGKLPPSCLSRPVAPCIPGGSLSALPYGNMIQVSPYAGIMHPIYDNFGPRIGIAWNVFPNTVVRAGYGIYYDTTSNITQEDQNPFGTWPSSTNLNLSYNTVGSPLTTINQVDGSPLSLVTTGVPWGTQSYFWDPEKRDPMSQQWNLTVQHEFTRNFAVTAAYVGSLNTRTDMTLDANTATTPGPGDAAVVNSRRPWPFYGTDTRFGTSLGRGNYNALQLKAEKRFSRGFQSIVSFTWAKTMDNGSSSWYSGHPENSYNLGAEYGISDADRPYILTGEAIYDLPVGRNGKWLRSGIAADILGGWEVSSIVTVEAGNPVVLSVGGDPANIGNTQYNYDRPNLVGNPHIANPSAKQWFNQAAFQTPVYAFGNAGRGLIFNPGYQNVDLGLFKNILINENVRVQLRVEGFNAFNLITLGRVDGYMTNNPYFGTIHGSIGSTPREIQLGAKLYF